MAQILSCGPFARSQSDGTAYINVPINTRADWVNTDEGHEEMEQAELQVRAAADCGKLSNDTIFDWQNDDQAVIRIPCDSWEDAEKKGPAIKALIPQITGAMVTDMITRKR